MYQLVSSAILLGVKHSAIKLRHRLMNIAGSANSWKDYTGFRNDREGLGENKGKIENAA